MFRTVPMSNIRSFSLYTQQACEQYQDGTCSVLIMLASCQQTCMTYTIAVCTLKNSCVTYTIAVCTLKNSCMTYTIAMCTVKYS